MLTNRKRGHMNFLKRAWLSTIRRKGKSLLLLLIVFILGNVIAGSVSINQASSNVEKKIKNSMGAKATLEADYEQMDKDGVFEKEDFEFPTIGLDLIQTVGNSSYVKYYDYNVMASMGSETLQPYVNPKLKEDMGDDPYVKYYSFTLNGIQYSKVSDIEEGKINLIDGRVFTDEEIASGAKLAIIDKRVADVNKLKVGDTAVFTSYMVDYNGEKPVEKDKFDIPLEIIGITEAKKKAPSEDGAESKKRDSFREAYEEQEVASRVYVPNQIPQDVMLKMLTYELEQNNITAEELEKYKDSNYRPVYFLNSPEDVDDFKSEVEPLLPQYYHVQAATDAYDSIAAPIKETAKMANYVLYVAIGASILIVTLVLLLFLRDRKHELGVYLSLGESRGKVVAQILVEVLLVAVLAITLSLFTGNLLADTLSGSMIQNQLEKNVHSDMIGGGYYYGFEDDLPTTQEVVEAYSISFSATYIVLFYIIGLGTMILSTLIPMLYIIRLNPKKIMM